MATTVAAAISRWWEEIVLRRRLGEIADVFIVLPVCVVNQLEGKWRRRRANEPKKEPCLPSGRAAAPEPSFLNSYSSFPRLVFAVAVAVVAVIVCSRSEKASRSFAVARCYVYSTTPRCTCITRSKEQPRDMQDSGPLNFLAIASFGTIYISFHVSSSSVSLCKREERRDRDCRTAGMSGAYRPMNTDEIHLVSPPLFSAYKKVRCVRG